MKTRFWIIILITTVIVSSTATTIIIPKDYVSFYPEWLEKNIDAAHKINDSKIPIIGVDVDEQLAVLTIYMTEENSIKYSQAVDDLIDVPYEILTDIESKELECLRLYKDIKELSASTEYQLAERQAMEKQNKQLTEYVKNNCPDYKDLKLMYDNFSKISESESNLETNLDYTPNDSDIKCKGSKMCITEEIVRIIDGDTIYLQGDYKIRLSLTNTPERHEIGFHDASRFTAELCPVGTIAMVDQDDLQPYDVYDRVLGKVVCGGKTLNSELLYTGHANILTKYCTTSEFSDETWAQEFGC